MEWTNNQFVGLFKYSANILLGEALHYINIGTADEYTNTVAQTGLTNCPGIKQARKKFKMAERGGKYFNASPLNGSSVAIATDVASNLIRILRAKF